MLKPFHVYKIAKGIQEPKLRSKPVVFVKMTERAWDIKRALVAILNKDGSMGDYWLINPSFLCEC